MSSAIVITEFGGPEVLQWREVKTPRAQPGEVLIRVKAAAVGPTDLRIRTGNLTAVFPQRPGDVLGFEASGVVEAVGEGANANVGDEVAALLPSQGGYGELVATNVWYSKAASVSWAAAAALPASADAAVGTLRQIRAVRGDTLVVLGAVGAVGLIVTQLAALQGIRVIGAARKRDAGLVQDVGGEFVEYGSGVFDRIGSHVDAVIAAAGHGELLEAVAATRDPSRVVTLTGGPDVATSGALLSHPSPNRAPDALATTMPLLATGELRLKQSRTLPIGEAAEAHRLLESGQTSDKIVLSFD
ncbi:zinc-binding dehydrogenase [Curtobacterium sp. MCBA15_008]|uniref:alcohol dehydrogenase catalytic domain-containing protein n=1 Tax=Curtobacterium sp. MCBA15_008 TaxID=1898736 RepID=UPI0008DCDEA5|nr:zinc-binding dehydrogenase [Curtobacterium sp. MCBA15_008]OII06938.1 hypothetical protein BIU96_05030 [Curtobacterium sp. MCBA15_008]